MLSKEVERSSWLISYLLDEENTTGLRFTFLYVINISALKDFSAKKVRDNIADKYIKHALEKEARHSYRI